MVIHTAPYTCWTHDCTLKLLEYYMQKFGYLNKFALAFAVSVISLVRCGELLFIQSQIMDCTTRNPSGSEEEIDEQEAGQKVSPEYRITIYPEKRAIPKYRTGGFAILVAMLIKEEKKYYRGFMTETEIKQHAKPYVLLNPAEFKSDTGKFTYWDCMRSLIKRKFVAVAGQEANEYSLTPLGRGAAKDCFEQIWPAYEQATNEKGNVLFSPKDFEMTLFLDTSEVYGKKANCVDPVLKKDLEELGVSVEVNRLNVGDFVWVCRNKAREMKDGRFVPNNVNTVVLPYVLERKRLDDLLHSMHTGRYDEQKQRLKETKMHVIYVLEAYTGRCKSDRNQTLIQYVISDMKDEKLEVEETASLQATWQYLVTKTKELKEKYLNKTLVGMWKSEMDDFKDAGTDKEAHLMFFSDFMDYSCKHKPNNPIPKTETERFVDRLMSLKGVTEDMANAIAEKYPAPTILYGAYFKCDSAEEKSNLLADIDVPSTGSKIGYKISKVISDYYNYMYEN